MFRLACWLLAGIPAVLPPLAVGADAFPYSAYVRSDSADVYSGPADEFYATDRLPWGTKVEVFRHHSPEWVAVRPPEGSFSWVPADAVESTNDPSLVRVSHPGTTTRVGSRFSSNRQAEYIRLKPGEVLELLGRRVERVSSDRTEQWLKVAPVSGEYRWMRARDLSEHPPHDPPAEMLAEDSPLTRSAQLASFERLLDDTDATADDHLIPADPSVSPRPATTHAGSRNDAGWQSRDANRTGRLATNDRSRPSHPTTSQPLATADRADLPADLGPHESMDAEIDELDLRLSTIVAQPVETWELADVHDHLQRLLAAHRDPSRYERLQQLEKRIQRFMDVQQRYDDLLLAGAPSAGRASRQPPRLPSNIQAVRLAEYTEPHAPDDQPANSPNTPSRPGSSPYDGQGWLMPVFTSRQDVPHFALTDDQGHILQFVSAAPGLNLRRYQRRKVGVLGQKGYLAALQKPHLTASRVVLLDRR